MKKDCIDRICKYILGVSIFFFEYVLKKKMKICKFDIYLFLFYE